MTQALTLEARVQRLEKIVQGICPDCGQFVRGMFARVVTPATAAARRKLGLDIHTGHKTECPSHILIP